MPEHDALKVVLAFPNTYSIGITSLGYQVIWAILAQRKDVDIRRLFTDEGDATPKRIDLFGLSLNWELDGPVLLKMLEKVRIPIWSHLRSQGDPIVFGGGPVLTANPEPFAPFFDVILLGDGEDLVPNFIETIKKENKHNRKEVLRKLTQVAGIYVPEFYAPKYDSEGFLQAIEPIDSTIPPTIRKQTYQGNKLSHSSVITPEAAWPNIHMVEVVRSCPEMCRFCMASYLTLPFRTNSLEEGLIPAVEKGIEVTNRLGLLGASVTQHPQFEDLTKWLGKDQFENLHLSISSIRACTVTKQMCEILRKRGSKSITIAIESGSSRMREMINKKLNEEEIMNAVKYAYEGGLKGIKLYGMVGLPEENIEDIEQTAQLMITLKRLVPSLRFRFGISTFVPKAHTPFQWFGVNPVAKKHLKGLSKQLKKHGIEVREESYGWSLIQALISRSDRRLASVIHQLKDSKNSLGEWKKAYKSILDKEIEIDNKTLNNLPKLPKWENVIFKEWDTSLILPWNHLEGPLNKDILIKHNHLSINNVKETNT